MARVVMLVLAMVLAAVAGVWGQQAAQQQEVDAQGMQQQEQGMQEEAGKGQGGLFGRMARMLDSGSAEDDDGLPVPDHLWEASKDEGEAVDPSRPWGGGGSSSDVPDAWGIDRALQMVQRALDGEPTLGFKDMVANAKDLQDAWANPVVFKYIFSQFPLFQAIKPLAVLGRKEQVTAQDVSAWASVVGRRSRSSLGCLSVVRPS
jgi:type II secretory pathway pseudopilin PulG